MDLQSMHTFVDEIFNLDKNTGDLGKKLSELKDHFSNLHKDFTEKDSLIQQQKEELNVLSTKNNKLIEANGEMLLRIPVKQESPYTPEIDQPKVSGIDALLERTEY